MTAATPTVSIVAAASRRRWRSAIRPAIAIVLLLLVVSLGGFGEFDADDIDPELIFSPPSGQHLFGTDNLGRDVLLQALAGARQTVFAGLLGVLVCFTGGILVGATAASGPRWSRLLASRTMDVVLALPAAVIVILGVTGFGRDTYIVAICVGINAIPHAGRLVQNETLRVRALDYIEAARISGASPGQIMRGHILPNALTVLLATFSIEFARMTLGISSFTFLGLGTPPPTPDLGALVNSGSHYIATAWWLSILPGILLTLIVVIMFVLGRRQQRG